jgi:hypothetical protein
MTELSQEQSEPQAQNEDLKQRIAKSVGADMEPAAPADPGEETVQTEDPEVELDFGEGVRRKVSAKELADLYRSREELETQRKAAEQLLRKSATLQQLHEQIENLSPEQRNAVLDVFENPEKYATRRQDDYTNDEFEYQPERPVADPALQRRIDQLEAQLGSMVQERTKQQITQRAEQALANTNMFSAESLARNPNLKGLRDLAYEKVLYEAASNPNADLNALAIKLDVDTARALKASNIRPESPDVRGRKEVLGFAPENPMTADDLNNGSIARKIQERLASLGGG